MVFVLGWNELRDDLERLFYGGKSQPGKFSVCGGGIGGIG
jgi:hypothetical protein